MKKRTTHSNLKESIYEFDEYDIKQLILSKGNLSDSDSKTMTFTFTYKVNSDLKGAIVKIQYAKKEKEKSKSAGMYYLDLTSTEMNADKLAIKTNPKEVFKI